MGAVCPLHPLPCLFGTSVNHQPLITARLGPRGRGVKSGLGRMKAGGGVLWSTGAECPCSTNNCLQSSWLSRPPSLPVNRCLSLSLCTPPYPLPPQAAGLLTRTSGQRMMDSRKTERENNVPPPRSEAWAVTREIKQTDRFEGGFLSVEWTAMRQVWHHLIGIGTADLVGCLWEGTDSLQCHYKGHNLSMVLQCALTRAAG